MNYDDWKLATPPYESDEMAKLRDPHIDQERCELCGEWLDWDKLMDGICPECISDFDEQFKTYIPCYSLTKSALM
jgi:hypothetical protein